MTPDSFHDGGKYNGCLDVVLNHVLEMIRGGADIIDVGGESTRPNATSVPVEIELQRVIPIIKLIRENCPEILISIDTMKATVAEAAIQAGANIINDVSGLSDARMLDVARETGAGLVLMHGYKEHISGKRWASREEIAHAIVEDIVRLIKRATDRGVDIHQLCVDPGFGFGKKGDENLEALDAIPLLVEKTQRPVLVGFSNKHFVESIYDKYDCSVPVGNNLDADSRLALAAYERGARVVRTHKREKIPYGYE